MLFFLGQGYRVVAHDRRGHGRSSQTDSGNDMDTYAADVIELAAALDLKDAVHIGHSTGGGEVVRYAARAEPGRVAKAVLIGAVPPIMLKSEANPEGLALEVFDGFRKALVDKSCPILPRCAGRTFLRLQPGRRGRQAGPHWWRQGMMGGAKAQYDCIKAFSETDFTRDLEALNMPVLVMHGTDDQIVPIHNPALKSTKLLRNGRLKTYEGLSHGLCQTHPDVVNADLLAFIRS
jgi:non-heme chloroperoxidase